MSVPSSPKFYTNSTFFLSNPELSRFIEEKMKKICAKEARKIEEKEEPKSRASSIFTFIGFDEMDGDECSDNEPTQEEQLKKPCNVNLSTCELCRISK